MIINLFPSFSPVNPLFNFTNSVDPDKMVHKDINCFPLCSRSLIETLITTVVMSKFKAGRDNFQNTGVKELD